MPVAKSGIAALIESDFQEARATAPVVRSNAVVLLKWTVNTNGVSAVNIYNTNGTRLAVVSSAYDNCTLRGFTPGQSVALYATSTNATLGIESDQSHIVVTQAEVVAAWTQPRTDLYALAAKWPCVNRVTNILQSSTNLTTWTTASRFRGTNGTAVVALANVAPKSFYRVQFQNVTNVTPGKLTLEPLLTRVSWNNPTPGRTVILSRLADAQTGSYLPIATNGSAASVIVPVSADKYRALVLR